MEVISKRWLGHSAGRAWIAFTVAILGVALIATASPARAQFGTVTLTQSGTSVNFDVVLNAGFFFQETADGDEALVFFNDSLPGSTITNIVATLNGSIVNIPGGLSGFTNLPGVVTSAGTFTALVECTVHLTAMPHQISLSMIFISPSPTRRSHNCQSRMTTETSSPPAFHCPNYPNPPRSRCSASGSRESDSRDRAG